MNWNKIEDFLDSKGFSIIQRNDKEHDCHSLYINGQIISNVWATYKFYGNSDQECDQILLGWANDEL